MTDFEQAFEDLLAADKESNGQVQERLTIGDFQSYRGGVYDAVINILTTDETTIAGGIGEHGGFKAMVRTTVPVPPKYTPCGYTDAQGELVSLQVLSTNENDGYTEIVAGDPSA